jgi:hypothetical protein
MKFVALDVPNQRIVIGHRTAKGFFVDAVVARALVAGRDYVLGLSMKGAGVSITLDGQFVLSHGFNSALADGAFGVVGRTGETSFDAFRVRTNDPAFAAAAANAPPVVSANTSGGFEGAAGTTRTIKVTLTLDKPALGGETVLWSTADGTATAGSDYQAVTGQTVTFLAGATSADVYVTVIGDATVEGDETFSIVVSSPDGLTLGAKSAIVTIQNDDSPTTTTPTRPKSRTALEEEQMAMLAAGPAEIADPSTIAATAAEPIAAPTVTASTSTAAKPTATKRTTKKACPRKSRKAKAGSKAKRPAKGCARAKARRAGTTRRQ